MAQDFRGQNLAGASFQGQNLAQADFRGANLEGADFRGANLRGANFSAFQGRRTGLDRANFAHAQLQGANFNRASLRSANFSHSQVGYTAPSLGHLLLSAGLALGLTTLALLLSQSALLPLLAAPPEADGSLLLPLVLALLGLLQLAGLGLLLGRGWSRATAQILGLSLVGTGAVSLVLGLVVPPFAANPSLLALGAVAALVLVLFLARSPHFSPLWSLPVASLLTLLWDLPLLHALLQAGAPGPETVASGVGGLPAHGLLVDQLPLDLWLWGVLAVGVTGILGLAIGALSVVSHRAIVVLAQGLGMGLAGLLLPFLASLAPLATLESDWLPLSFSIHSLLLLWVSLSAACNLSRSHLAPVRHGGLWLRTWGGTSFRGADLSGANFLRAVVDGSQFQGANLYRVYWRGVEGLGRVLGGPGAGADRRVLELVVGGYGYRRDLRGIDLRGMNLAGVNLETANLAGADLRGASLEGALLRDANLTGVRAEGANFTGAALTGVWVDKLRVDRRTILHPVHCDYVFLKDQPDDPETWTRRPSDPDASFQGRDLARLLQP